MRTLGVCFDEAGFPSAGIGSKGGTARAISWQALVNIKISCTLDSSSIFLAKDTKHLEE